MLFNNQNHILMKLFRRYLLEVANCPVGVPTAVATFLALIGLTIIAFAAGGKELKTNLPELMFLGLLGTGFIFGLISKRIIKKKITVFEIKPDQLVLLHHPDTKKEFYKQPFWGKVPSTIIQLPKGWGEIKAGDKKTENWYVSFNLNEEELLVIVPLTITFLFVGHWHAKDFSFVNPYKRKLDLGQYIAEQAWARQPHQGRTQMAAENWFNSKKEKTSDEQFQKIIAGQLDFNNIIWNIPATQKEVGKPRIED